jgi:hypothetical protein
MRLIYLSTDELNQALVGCWSVRQGIEVECPDLRDRSWTGRCDAVLLDLDNTTSEWLEMLAMWLECTRRRTGRVAAHGYSPAGDAFRGAFGGEDMTVSSRLRPKLLRDLARPADASALGRVEDESDALTWVDLVQLAGRR